MIIENLLLILDRGLLDIGWIGGILVTLLSCHITLMAVTLYLHRCECHLGLELHPVLKHFFRLHLWLTTGMSTRSWVSIHRKHHAKVESDEDPHSPFVFGISKVLWQGAELYRLEAKNEKTIQDYGHGTPTDWLERVLYGGIGNKHGIRVLMVLFIIAFGIKGVTLWSLQMITVPFLAAGVINGVGHYYGYRNFSTPDGSTNIVPLAFIICGEELHNNHHAYPSSAKFSLKWWEFDMGWMYIVVFKLFGLARVKKSVPRISFDYSKCTLDHTTLRAVFKARMHVSASYVEDVIGPTIEKTLREKVSGTLNSKEKNTLKALKRQLLWVGSHQINNKSKNVENITAIVSRFPILDKVIYARKSLEKIWNTKFDSQDGLLNAMRNWCDEAEKSDVPELKSFAQMLCAYQVEPSWH